MRHLVDLKVIVKIGNKCYFLSHTSKKVCDNFKKKKSLKIKHQFWTLLRVFCCMHSNMIALSCLGYVTLTSEVNNDEKGVIKINFEKYTMVKWCQTKILPICHQRSSKDNKCQSVIAYRAGGLNMIANVNMFVPWSITHILP